jgi:hypothetical protein
LIAAVGAALLIGARDRQTPAETTLATSSALALATADIVYAGVRKRISPVYLLDALVQVGLTVAHMAARRAATPRSDRAS